MNAAAPSVQLTTRDDVAYLTLESPPYNILTCRLMEQICRGLEQVAADRTLKALAVGASGKAFSAGADVGEHAPEKAAELIAVFGRMVRLFAELELPVVMAVDGAALGGGFELTMMADVLLATERATFGQPEIRLGFLAPVGVAYLPHRIGHAKAMEVVCSGRTYSAAEMLSAGFVSRLVPAGELEGALESTLDEFRKVSPVIMRMVVRTMKRLRHRPFPEGLAEAERVFLEELMATDDVREGIASFFEKRKPAWKNR